MQSLEQEEHFLERHPAEQTVLIENREALARIGILRNREETRTMTHCHGALK